MEYLLIIAVLPIFLIGYFLYKIDCDKEPISLLIKLLLLGICSCFPSIIFGLILESFFPSESEMNFVTLFMYVFISIAFVEEFFKFLFTYFGSYEHKEFNNLYDMIIYATFVSLGFALFENILYVFNSGISEGLKAGLMVGLFRAVLSVPGHACFGIVMGYYLGISKIAYYNGNKDLIKKNMIKGLLFPVLMHTFYDFCLFTNNGLLLIVLLVYVICIYVFLYKRIRHISKNVRDFKDVDVYCSRCGFKLTGKYCQVCGHLGDIKREN